MQQKRSTIEILAAIAIIGGALYFVLYTERGQRWLDRMIDTAMDSLDALLASLEEVMSEEEALSEEAD